MKELKKEELKMEAVKLPVYNSQGNEIETIILDKSVFDGIINASVLYEVVKGYRANQRKGLAATKTRGEVSGGGKKPWKQKGTGRARVGSTRSPLWRHGGVVFGPHPKDFSYKLTAKARNSALKSALNSKIKENRITVLDSIKTDSSKTRDMVKIFSNLKVDIKKAKKDKVLLLVDKIDNALKLSLRNIDFLRSNLAKDTNVYEVFSCRNLIITKDGLSDLTKRLK